MASYPFWKDTLFDRFEQVDTPEQASDPIGFPGYADAIKEARARSRSPEAAVAGVGHTGRHEVAAVLFDFSFLGGSMGVVVGDAVEAACGLALRHRLPLVVATSTGGARMQEGMAALAQMPRTAAAIAGVGDVGLARIALLGHPTTGGVYASFATACDFLIAQREATIGFAGPRVAEAFTGEPIPKGSHTAEKALEHGLVDALAAPDEMRTALDGLLDLLTAAGGAGELADPIPATETAGAWESYQLARHPDRPPPSFYLDRISPERFQLTGGRDGIRDDAVIAAVGRVSGRPVMFIAFDRKSPTAGGYRKARRAVDVASRLGLPIVTMVDTPGADPSYDSEYSGLAGEISATSIALLKAQVPVIALTTGEGGSGGALALAVGDRTAIMRNAVFSVIAPEGAAAILHRDVSRAEEVSDHLKPTSESLLSLGIADEIVEEPPGGAHADPQVAAREVGRWLSYALQTTSADLEARRLRFSDLKPRRPR